MIHSMLCLLIALSFPSVMKTIINAEETSLWRRRAFAALPTDLGVGGYFKSSSHAQCCVYCATMPKCTTWQHDLESGVCVWFTGVLPAEDLEEEDSSPPGTLYLWTLPDVSITQEESASGPALLFRLTVGSPSNAFQLWDDDVTVPDGYVRSPLISQPDYWQTVTKLRVSMLKDGVEVMYVIFDAEDSDRTSWFSGANIVESSFTDIQSSPANLFSAEGDPTTDRYFTAISTGGSCGTTDGWFLVAGAAPICSFETNALIYCPGPAYCQFTRFGLRADVFEIYATT